MSEDNKDTVEADVIEIDKLKTQVMTAVDKAEREIAQYQLSRATKAYLAGIRAREAAESEAADDESFLLSMLDNLGLDFDYD